MVTWLAGTITRVVEGTYLHANGSPRAGKIVFTPTAVEVTDASGAVVVTRTPIVVTLDVNGHFSVAMATTDNYLLSPNTWAYDVAIRIHGLKPAFARIYLPFGDGTPIDLPTHILYSTTDIPTAPLAPAPIENPIYPPVITPRGPIGPQGIHGINGTGGGIFPIRLGAYVVDTTSTIDSFFYSTPLGNMIDYVLSETMMLDSLRFAVVDGTTTTKADIVLHVYKNSVDTWILLTIPSGSIIHEFKDLGISFSKNDSFAVYYDYLSVETVGPAFLDAWFLTGGAKGAKGDTGPEGAPGLVPIFTRQNDISPVTGLTRFYFESARTIVGIRASVGTPSVGSAVVVSTKINGVSIGTIYIAEGTYTNTLATSYIVNPGDYATVDILAVGSSYSGSDLSVILSID